MEQLKTNCHGLFLWGLEFCSYLPYSPYYTRHLDSSCNCQQESEPVDSSHIGCACIFLINMERLE